MPALTELRLNRRELLGRGALGGLGLGLAGFPAQALVAAAAARDFPAIKALLDGLVDSGKLPGAVASIGFGDQPPQFITRGKLAFGDAPDMTPDTLFRIYSMTKVVTGMAAMELIERGRLRLDQPIADFLPAFGQMQVLLSPHAPLDQVRPARTQITVRHLLTHTAGLGYTIIQHGPIQQAYLAAGLGAGRLSRHPLPGTPATPAQAPSLAAFADRLAALPLVYEPGTQWSYSVGLDLLGRVIELASGKSFDRFLQETIFGPCGMADTAFHVPGAKAARLATNYGIKDGKALPIDPGASSVYLEPPAVAFGGSGLVSTPRDYDKFMAMLVAGGRSGRRRVLGRGAVQQGGKNLVPSGAITAGSFVDSAGNGAGARAGIGTKTGVIGWSGAAGTVFRVDLARGIRVACYTQYMPSEAYAIYDTYPAAAATDLAAPQLI